MEEQLFVWDIKRSATFILAEIRWPSLVPRPLWPGVEFNDSLGIVPRPRAGCAGNEAKRLNVFIPPLCALKITELAVSQVKFFLLKYSLQSVMLHSYLHTSKERSSNFLFLVAMNSPA